MDSVAPVPEAKKKKPNKRRLSDMFKIYEEGDLIIAIPLEPQYDNEGRRIPAFWLGPDGLSYEDDSVRALLEDVDEEEWNREVLARYERLMATGGTWAESFSEALKGACRRPFPRAHILEDKVTLGAIQFTVAESAMENAVVTPKMQKALRKIIAPNGQSCSCAHVKVGKITYVIFPAHLAYCGDGDLYIEGDGVDKTRVGALVPKSAVVMLGHVNPSTYRTTDVAGDLAGFRTPDNPFFRGWAALTVAPLAPDKVLPGTCTLMAREFVGGGRLYPSGGGMLSHTCSTNVGDCGSLLVIAKTDGASRYVGMHVGGAKHANFAVDLRFALPKLVERIGGVVPANIVIKSASRVAVPEAKRDVNRTRDTPSKVRSVRDTNPRPPVQRGTPAARGPNGLRPSAERAAGRWASESMSPIAEEFVPGNQPFRQSPQDAEPQPGGVDSSGR